MTLAQGSLEKVCDILIENRENDYFNCGAITGMVRRGKSNLAHQLTTKIYPGFDYQKNYIGNPKHGETFRNLFDTPKKSACWLDEAEKVLSAEQRMTKEQWFLQQLFNQFASHNKTIIFTTPTFRRIDSRWRDEHITFWIHIYRRGCGILLTKREMVSSHDVWGLDAMREMEMSVKTHNMTDEVIFKCFDENPCALFYFTFRDWTEEEKAEYTKWKELSQVDLRNEFEMWDKLALKKEKLAMSENYQHATRGIGRIAAYLNYQYQISYREIGELIGYDEVSVRKFSQSFYESLASIDKNALPKQYFNEGFFDFAAIKAEKKNML